MSWSKSYIRLRVWIECSCGEVGLAVVMGVAVVMRVGGNGGAAEHVSVGSAALVKRTGESWG